MITIDKIYPATCKHYSCIEFATFEFTDVKVIGTEQEDGLVKEEVKTVVLGHACFNHVEEVNKMMKEIHERKEKK